MTTREFLHDHTIVRYTLASIARDEVEAWANFVIATAHEWPADRVYCAIHDFSAIPTLTPTIRHHAERAHQHFIDKHFPGIYSAILVKNTVFNHIGKLFLERDLKNTKIQRRLFFTPETALTWLLEFAEKR